MPMTDACAGRRPRSSSFTFPLCSAPLFPSSTFPASADLRFSPDVLADIYLAKITNWNDPRIAKDNPGVNLPDQKIIVVHRSDGSGTTFILTDYLSKVSQDWAGGPGKGTAINWPTGVGGKGNEGVAAQVRQLPGAIGYVELIYALQNHIDFGAIKNAAGNWVKASIEGVTAAAATRQDIPPTTASPSPTLRAPTSYPISSFTYLLIPTQSHRHGQGKGHQGHAELEHQVGRRRSFDSLLCAAP